MKTIIAIITLLGLAVGANAQGYSVYATPGTAINKGTNYAIISPASKNGGTPLVTYLNMNALADSGTVTLTSYVSTNSTTATAANLGATNYVSSTNSFVAADWVIIEHTTVTEPRFRNEAAIVAVVDNTNHIVLATAPVTTVAVGDKISRMLPNATIPLASSATAREINGNIVSGQANKALLLTLIGSAASTNTINAASATFVP